MEPAIHTHAALKTAVADCLARHMRSSPASIVDRMESAFGRFRGLDYSIHLEEDLDASLQYLPAAFQYLLVPREDRPIVAECVGRYCAAWYEALVNLGLWPAVYAALQATLESWSAKYEGDRDGADLSDETAALKEYLQREPPFVELLNAFLERSRQNDKVFSTLLTQWVVAAQSPVAHAFILDFYLRIRQFPEDELLFRHPLVLQFAFDGTCLKRHWSVASAEMQQRCSPFHLVQIESIIGPAD